MTPAVHIKHILDTSQCKWLTSEAELHAVVLGCAKFGGFITTATP